MKYQKTISTIIVLVSLCISRNVYSDSYNIHDAVKSGDLVKVRDILNTDPSLVNSRDSKGKTPLYWSCVTGKIGITQLLLQKGADISIGSSDGTSPLHVASSYGWLDTVRLLVEKGANVNDSRNPERIAPLHLVAGIYVSPRTQDEMTVLMGVEGLQIVVVEKPRILPKQIHALEVAKFLISKGAFVDALTIYGQTPLITVIDQGCSVELVKLLIDKGANVNATVTRGGETPLHVAATASFDDSEVVEVLLANGASINATTVDGWTALGIAEGFGHMKVAKLLRERGRKDLRGSR